MVGIVKAADKKAAIARAIKKYRLPTNERRRLMALRNAQEGHSWAVYQIKSRPAQFVCFVEAADRQTAIARAIKEYGVPAHEPSWLMALRRD